MLKQIRYFQSVVKNSSFSKAAEENFISQSAISQQVQALERELGFPLLERRNRSFSLTPAGEYFYQKSLILTADYERMCAEAGKIAKGKQASLRIGYLRNYSGTEFQTALALFSSRYPSVSVSIVYGSHEELYTLLRTEQVDIAINDQRRAFSDLYVNLVLHTGSSFIEVPASSPLAQMKQLTPQELKNFPCILIATPSQQQSEVDYYQTFMGFQGEFLFAENLQEARLMVVGKRGFLPIEGTGSTALLNSPITHVPLTRGAEVILKNFCVFWKKDNSGFYIEEFAELLKEQFQK